METNKLLQIIDNRIRKILREKNVVIKYTGTVVGIINDDWAKVKLAGDDTVFTMANQSMNFLFVGDNVYIETIGGDLNTGVIKQRFNTLTSAEISENSEKHTIQKCVFPLGSVIITSNKINPSTYFGGVWIAQPALTINSLSFNMWKRIT